MVWQTSSGDVYSFQNYRAYLNPNRSQYKSVASGRGATSGMNYILGYQNTKVLQVYNAWCKANGRTNNIVQPVDALESFTTSNPAPKGSTGWFIPSPKELHMLCYKDVDEVFYIKGTDKNGTWKIVNTSIGNAGYTEINEYVHWSSSENIEHRIYAYSLQFYDCIVFIDKMKSRSSYTRAVCAF